MARAQPRAVVSPVLAMARPRRPSAERAAVRALARTGSSARCQANRIAHSVVAAYLADLNRTDPLERALFEAAQHVSPDPLHKLATSPDYGVAELFARERIVRFESRECCQLTPAAWDSETQEIAAKVRRQLARRYRDFLK